jgi:hypothetical protein
MDMRRAVVFINTLSILINALSLVLIHTEALFWYDGGNSFEEAKQELAEDQQDQADIMDDLLRKLTILAAVGMVVSIAAIYGALVYEKRLLLSQVAYVIVSLTLTFYFNRDASEKVDTYDYEVFSDISGMVGTMINVYVHLSLVKEMRCGTMSPETYATREAYSCCCLASPATDDDGDGDVDGGGLSKADKRGQLTPRSSAGGVSTV